MEVLHVISGSLTGGAAKGAYNLHAGMRQLGLSSKVFTDSDITYDDPTVYTLSKNKLKSAAAHARIYLDRLPAKIYTHRAPRIFSTGYAGVNLTKHPLYQAADVIHLHWINSLVSLNTIEKIDKPVVWTMRDMWPFTGGCHYAIECNQYLTTCKQCPQLQSTSNEDLAFRTFLRKQHYPKHFYFVGISKWLSRCAKQSKLLKSHTISTISNCIDTNTFTPEDQQAARKKFKLPTEKKIILAGSQQIDNFYKGFDLLVNSLTYLEGQDYLLVLFGDLKHKVLPTIPIPYHHIGYIHDEAQLRTLYSSADLYVLPSILEAFGKTAAESLACGTPVVCFRGTGAQDIVSHQRSGYLATPHSPKSLADGIQWVTQQDSNSFVQAARQDALRFDAVEIAQQYQALYSEILHPVEANP